ncbi:MAG: MFS transporter [Bulleidia sp.]
MKQRLQLQYNALHILFWLISCSLNGFVAIYLKYKGLDNTLIGVVTGSSCVLITFISPMVTGFVQSHQNVTIPKMMDGLMLISSVLFLLISFVSIPSPALIVIYVLNLTMFLCAVPLLSTIAMNYNARGIDLNFGLSRGLGSVSYAASAVGLSLLVEWLNPDWLSVVYAVSAVLFLVFFHTLPDYQEEKGETKHSGSLVTVIMKYRTLTLILLGWAFAFAGSTSLSTYLINVVENLGGNTTMYGLAIFAMAASEMPAMAVTRKLMRRFNALTLILVSGVCYVFRNILVALAPNLFVLFIGMMFQSVTYGLLTSVLTYYVADVCEKDDQVMGQTLIGIMTTGLGSMLGNVLGGVLQDMYGLNAMLVFVTVSTIIGIIIMVSVCITQIRKNVKVQEAFRS